MRPSGRDRRRAGRRLALAIVLQQLRNASRRLRADGQPIIDTRQVEPDLDAVAARDRVIETQLLETAAAPAAVGHYHVVEGFLLAAAAVQSNRHHRSPCPSYSVGVGSWQAHGSAVPGQKRAANYKQISK